MVQPTSPNDRYQVLDILRGFALLGVLVANMNTHSGYFFLSEIQQQAFSTASADGFVIWFLHFLVEGKFYSIFSLLFGIGFALQLKRADESQKNFSGLFLRRLLILFIFGLLHAVFLYVGDILTVYAITGLFLLLFRKASNKALIISAIVFVILPVIQYTIFWLMNLSANTAPPPPPDPAAPRFFDQLILQYQTGSFSDIIKNNIGGLIYGRYPDLIFTGRFFRVLAMFLIGFYATRKMLFVNLNENLPFIKKVLFWGLVIGIPCNIALALMMETDAYYAFQPAGIIQPAVYAFGVPALGLAYAAAIALMFAKNNKNRLLQLFAPVGRMALTNYLMQSVICCIIFMNYGFGLFARVGAIYLFFMALIIYALQVLLSHLWLRHYRFGPMEWLWRSFTYGKWQSMHI